MSEWQPIETAPKDGTTIIAWSEYMLEPATVRWGRVRWGREDWTSVWECSEVIECQGDFGTEYKDTGPITHWQPLPAPPRDGRAD